MLFLVEYFRYVMGFVFQDVVLDLGEIGFFLKSRLRVVVRASFVFESFETEEQRRFGGRREEERVWRRGSFGSRGQFWRKFFRRKVYIGVGGETDLGQERGFCGWRRMVIYKWLKYCLFLLYYEKMVVIRVVWIRKKGCNFILGFLVN